MSYKVLLATMALDIGGAETHVVELAKELKRQGFTVIVASNGGVFVKELEEAGIKHYVVPLHNKSIKNMLESKKRLRKIIEDEKIDIVHAHARIPGFICGQLHKKMKFPFVTTAHWIFKTGYGLKYITNWGERTMSVSEDIKKYLIDNYKLPAEQISVTINGIDTEKFAKGIDANRVKKEFELGNDVFRIVYCSRLDGDRSRAAFDLLDAAEKLNDSIPNLEIVVVGGGTLFEELNAKGKGINAKLGKRLIIMTGGRTDVNLFASLADVFVGVSRSALEAMACEAPVIVAGDEGMIGFFDESKMEVAYATNFCCRGCEMSSPKRIFADIMKVFAMSEEERAAAGKFGRDVILKSYSVTKMAKDNIDMYMQALKDR